MTDFVAYIIVAWIGYILGYFMGWFTGLNKFGENKPLKEEVSPEKNLCTDYSHLRNSSIANNMPKTPLTYTRASKSSDKIYDAEIIQDEYRVNKVI